MSVKGALIMIKLVTYNILANAYIRPDWFPQTDPAVLQWEQRKAALLARLLAFDSDILCLQEVEASAFPFLLKALEPHGYAGLYAQKGQGRPDGCASFFRPASLAYHGHELLYYQDQASGAAPSGHLALLVDFTLEGRILRVVNTHVRWDKSDIPSDQHVGYKQIMGFLNVYSTHHALAEGWIICGDFNASPMRIKQKLHAAINSIRLT
jgi:mRNA deadenylase 3'-5' endonuclease subunit Ccr4